MEINKVVYNGDTLLDLTSDTVTPQTLLSGATAHAANGQSISGTVDLNGKADKVANATAGNFAGLDSSGNLTDSGKSASDFDNVWLGTRAEHTAAETAGTLPATAIIGIEDEYGNVVQSDWNQTDSTADDYIKNKPTIPDNGSQISMTGYSKPSTTSAIIPSDTVNTAIGKLEKGLEDAGGGGDDPSIEVYKSEDFEPLSYTVGSTTYYCPRVTFPGSSTGKILAIKAMDANGVTRTFDPTYLMHFGMNVFSPLVTTGSWSSYKPDKVFNSYGNSTFGIEYLGDGGYHVHGTTTTSSYTRIGTVINPVVGAWGFEKLPIEALNPIIRCAHIQGQYAGLSIGGSTSSSYFNPIDEESPFTYTYSWDYSSGSSPNTSAQYRIYIDIYLKWEAGTYDCTFYPQIMPKAIDDSYSKYEKTFCLNDPALMTMPIMEKQGLNESLYTYSPSSNTYVTYLSYGIDSEASSSKYPSTNAGNASCFGVIDYPIVHSGLNTFTYGWPNTNPNNLLKLEVYYKPSYKRKVSDEISDIEYSISNGHLNKYFISGERRLDKDYDTTHRSDTNHIWLSEVPHLRYNSPYLPKGVLWLGDYIWFSSSSSKYKSTTRKYDISVTGGINQKWGINYIRGFGNLLTGDYFNQYGSEHPLSYDISMHHRYFPSSEFYWSTTSSDYYERCFGLPCSVPYTSTNYIYYKIIFDYDGWDDSPSFEQ